MNKVIKLGTKIVKKQLKRYNILLHSIINLTFIGGLNMAHTSSFNNNNEGHDPVQTASKAVRVLPLSPLDTNEAVPMSVISKDSLRLVLSYLPKKDLASMSQVCTLFHKLSRDYRSQTTALRGLQPDEFERRFEQLTTLFGTERGEAIQDALTQKRRYLYTGTLIDLTGNQENPLQKIGFNIIKKLKIDEPQNPLDLFLLVAHSTKLFTDKMSENNQTEVIKALKDMSAEEREDFVEQAPKLFTSQMNEHNQTEVIKILRNLPEGERKDFVKQAPKLFTKKMNGYSQIKVIKILKGVPAEERKDLVEQVLRLFTDKMDGYDQTEVIKTLKDVPTKERQDLVEQVPKLFTKKMNGYNQTAVIEILKDVPAEERKSFVKQVLESFTDNMGGNDQVSRIRSLINAITELRKIPAAGRAGFFN
ncbi:MAG TPA: hypothetical protein DD412_00080 [Holosporales bacterium]|nr:hypothetical protein [Holosporales bacterium]